MLDVIFENLNNFGVEKLKALVTSNSTEIVEDNTDDAEPDTSNEAEDVEGENQVEDSTVGTEDGATEATDVENSSEQN